jgi:flagellar basal-body rod protein FlgC
MNVERMRAEVASVNLANANTVSAPGESGFVPQRVVARTAMAGVGAMSAARFDRLVSDGMAGPAAGVQASGAPAHLVMEPGHPLANAQGQVAYPGVDPVTEMLGLMSAVRSYEANVAAMNATRSMALKALDIGSGA